MISINAKECAQAHLQTMDEPQTTIPDAYSPPEIARLVESAGVAKSKLPLITTLILAALAGAFIALGAAAFTAAMTGIDPIGPHRLIGGLIFSLGLILVVLAGAELFTGNVLMVIACLDGKIGAMSLLRNWGVVYVGNFIGSALIAVLMWLTGLYEGGFGESAEKVALTKLDLSVTEAFARGVLCNILVCLAVWLSFGARQASGKVLVILWPISAFVLLGFEHSVANMFFFPQAVFAGAEISLSGAAANLIWVTFGNIIGGAGGVALAYKLAYLPQAGAK